MFTQKANHIRSFIVIAASIFVLAGCGKSNQYKINHTKAKTKPVHYVEAFDLLYPVKELFGRKGRKQIIDNVYGRHWNNKQPSKDLAMRVNKHVSADRGIIKAGVESSISPKYQAGFSTVASVLGLSSMLFGDSSLRIRNRIFYLGDNSIPEATEGLRFFIEERLETYCKKYNCTFEKGEYRKFKGFQNSTEDDFMYEIKDGTNNYRFYLQVPFFQKPCDSSERQCKHYEPYVDPVGEHLLGYSPTYEASGFFGFITDKYTDGLYMHRFTKQLMRVLTAENDSLYRVIIASDNGFAINGNYYFIIPKQGPHGVLKEWVE